jgi:hypothetical protein
VITVRRVGDLSLSFETARRVSTDEHNNLEVWAGDDGDELLYICAADRWFEVTVEEETTES